MKRVLLVVCITCICAVPCAFSAQKKPVAKPAAAAAKNPAEKPATKPDAKGDVTQGDFVARLFAAFHWGAGLPEEPKAADYRTILAGRRTFVYEAEDRYDPTRDDVSVKHFPMYGPFTGTGWLNGVSAASTVHFKYLLPIEGIYHLIVHAKGNGQVWKLESGKFTVSCGDRMNRVVVGPTGYLEAGFHEITVTLPPEGAIDSFTLSAPEVAAVEPLGGWRDKEPLTTGDMAQAGAALLGLEPTLPVDTDLPVQRLSAADVVRSGERVELTTKAFLGTFYSPKWVRAQFEGAHFEIPFTVKERGVYTLRLRYLGSSLEGELDGQPVYATAKPYFDWVTLGTLRLQPGSHLLSLQLPPTAGVDVLELQRLRSAPADYMKLMGITGSPDARVSTGTADAFVASLKERFKGRR